MKARFFRSAAEFRSWLEKNNAIASELWLGLYKKGSGKKGITYSEAVDEALCFGWIDGVRKSIDDERYVNRFTPRTSRSTWSAVNIKRARELIEAGRMTPPGLRAFEARADERSAIYSYEQRHAAKLSPAEERRFGANPEAWAWFQSAAPSYRKAAIWWVVSAKREETRERRLETLIADSEAGRTVRPLTRPTG